MRPRLILAALLVVALAAGGFLYWKSSHGPRRGAEAYQHTKAILDFGPRPPQSAALDSVRAYLAKQLEATGWTTQLQTFERSTAAGVMRFSNLRARFKATPWDAPVKGILCAHVDSKLINEFRFLGADDAASACAAILEIAGVLARENPDLAAGLELVFFDGEEAFGKEGITPFDGLYGSRYYANEWRHQPHKPTFGILLDMIGHKNLKIEMPLDTPRPLLDAVLAAADKEKASKHFAAGPSPTVYDDHVPLNLAGIPTVDVIGRFVVTVKPKGTFPNGEPRYEAVYVPWWHTAGDNLDLISPDSLDISIRVTLRVLREQLAEKKK